MDLLERFAPMAALRDGPDQPVRTVEVLFDLVWVLAFVQLAQALLLHQDWPGAIQSLILFAALWLGWIHSARAANIIEPDHPAGRCLLLVMIGFAVLMAGALPDAFGARAGLFAVAYVAIALIRSGYLALVLRGERMGQNFVQLGVWSVVSSLFWLAGVAFGAARLELWLVALLIDCAGPFVGYWLPRPGALPLNGWALDRRHLLLRYRQILLLALGGAFLLLGQGLAGAALDADAVVAALVGVMTVATLWWLSFTQDVRVTEDDERAAVRTQLPIAHGAMVGGAIALAAAGAAVIAAPVAAAPKPVIVMAVAGTLIHLGGLGSYRKATGRRVPTIYMVGAALLVAAGGLIHVRHASGLAIGLSVLGALVLISALSDSRFRPAD